MPPIERPAPRSSVRPRGGPLDRRHGDLKRPTRARSTSSLVKVITCPVRKHVIIATAGGNVAEARLQSDEERERYRELLAELRTVLPGVQVLFAFLLTAPFSARFSALDALGRSGFAVALVSAALSTVLLLAPTSYHRVAPRENRELRLRVAVALTVIGMLTLLVSIVAAVFVVTRFIFGMREGLIVGAAV